jgi:15-cis-phytoene synthase
VSGQDVEPANARLVRDSARSHEPDRYLAALLAPRDVRDDLIALAAFASELARIPDLVRDPMAGEIRIQWWRDAIHAGLDGQRSGQPVADAWSSAAARHKLPLAAIDDYLDAHTHTLYAAPPADVSALRLELSLIEGTPFKLAARILGMTETDITRTLIETAAQAYGLARLGMKLPHHLARGRVPVPPAWHANEIGTGDGRAVMSHLIRDARSQLQLVNTQFYTQSPALKTALLPLALVEPYLKALDNPARNAAHDIAGISPLTRVWRLARAHWKGRL